MTALNRLTTYITFFNKKVSVVFSANTSGGEEQSRADRCVYDEARAKRGKDAGAPNSSAIQSAEDAAPRSSVASAPWRARKRGAVVCAAVAMGLFLTTTSAFAAEPSFGIASFDSQATGPAGEAFTQAAAVPAAISTTLDFNTITRSFVDPAGGPVKDNFVATPPGLVGDPSSPVAMHHCGAHLRFVRRIRRSALSPRLPDRYRYSRIVLFHGRSGDLPSLQYGSAFRCPRPLRLHRWGQHRGLPRRSGAQRF